jgi:serine/threonine protein phosphatase PrpC
MRCLRVEAEGRSEQGRYRPNNEDWFLCDPAFGLFIVADGMGGQQAGETASRLAVETIARALHTTPLPPGASDEHIQQAIRRAVVQANEEILALAAVEPDYHSMGTTVVLLLLRPPRAYVASLGDSRCYHLRHGKIQQLTEDHSLAQALYAHGTISAEELKTHRFRNILWKYLGSREATAGPDLHVFQIQPNDRFLLATDGLTSVVPDDDILKILAQASDPQEAVAQLVRQALQKDSRDNITCVAVYLREEPSQRTG